MVHVPSGRGRNCTAPGGEGSLIVPNRVAKGGFPFQAYISVAMLLYWQTFRTFSKGNTSNVVVKQTLDCDPNVPANVFSDGGGVQMFTKHLGRRTVVTCFRNSCSGRRGKSQRYQVQPGCHWENAHVFFYILRHRIDTLWHLRGIYSSPGPATS